MPKEYKLLKVTADTHALVKIQAAIARMDMYEYVAELVKLDIQDKLIKPNHSPTPQFKGEGVA